MKVALCVCGRLENRYALEFVEYYKQLGFDHIYIGDNNHDGEEYFEDVLQTYIDINFVTICNYRNQECVQLYAFTDLYYKISKYYDWVAFFDFDEYLTLVKNTNIKEYLSKECFKNANQILINWKTYTDNNLIYDDGRPCLERFTTPMGNKNIEHYWLYEDQMVKSIIKTNIKDIQPQFVHLFVNDLLKDTTYNSIGEKINEFNIWQDIKHDIAYLKHFPTKTIDEYINNKCKRGTGDRSLSFFNQTYGIYKFFKYNEITPEKLNYLIEHKINLNEIMIKVALCVVGKLENRYAPEFVEYYKDLEFDHIYVGDNNDDEDGERLDEVLKSYIDDNFVTVINLRNLKFVQNVFYFDMYYKLSNDYDWIAFFDFDEFLTFQEDKNIKTYLSRNCFKNANQILINWKLYTDNNLIYDDGRPCTERFTEPMDINKEVQYIGSAENENVKCIVKTKLDNLCFDSVHYLSSDLLENTTYNSNGDKVEKLGYLQPINYNLAYVKHFFTKTIDEFICKIKKWSIFDFHSNVVSLNNFFKVNKITPEKIKYLTKNGYNTDDLIKTLQ